MSQQGVMPWYHIKRMESQFNAIGFGYLNGIWKVTRCGQGMYWHNCGQLVEGGGGGGGGGGAGGGGAGGNGTG